MYALVLYQLLQMSLLQLQELFGARCFIPTGLDFFPSQERWQYHPALPPTDVETSDGGVDCSICLERIEFAKVEEVDPVNEEEKERLLDKFRKEALADVARLSRWSYMVSLRAKSASVELTRVNRYRLVII